jgi:hypothetical protein
MQIELRGQVGDDLLFLVSRKERSEDSGSHQSAEESGSSNKEADRRSQSLSQ